MYSEKIQKTHSLRINTVNNVRCVSLKEQIFSVFTAFSKRNKMAVMRHKFVEYMMQTVFKFSGSEEMKQKTRADMVTLCRCMLPAARAPRTFFLKKRR